MRTSPLFLIGSIRAYRLAQRHSISGHAAVLRSCSRHVGRSTSPECCQSAQGQGVGKASSTLGKHAEALNLATNQTIDGLNPHGVEQHPCNKCGDCVVAATSSKEHALHELPALRSEKWNGHLHSGKVEWVEKLNGGGWRVHGKHYDGNNADSFIRCAERSSLCGCVELDRTSVAFRDAAEGFSAVGPGLVGTATFWIGLQRRRS